MHAVKMKQEPLQIDMDGRLVRPGVMVLLVLVMMLLVAVLPVLAAFFASGAGGSQTDGGSK
jgi:hypothetical protein